MKRFSNFILIGFRGVGKSSISKKLAFKTNFKLFSTDEAVFKQIAMPLEEFVQKESWEKFREIESTVCFQISKKSNYIIDCGGGVVEKEKNMKFLKSKGYVVYLHASLEIILQRIEKSSHRPSLLKNVMSFEDECRTIYKKRFPLYKKYSDFQINTDSQNSDFCAELIKDHYFKLKENQHGW